MRHCSLSASSACWGTGVTAIALDMPWFQPSGANWLEALDATTSGWRLWRSLHDVWACDVRVSIHRDDMIWRPAGWAAGPATDEFQCDTQSFAAGELWALLRIGLIPEECSTPIWVSVGLHRARGHESRSLRMLVQSAARHTWFELSARLRLPPVRVVRRQAQGRSHRWEAEQDEQSLR